MQRNGIIAGIDVGSVKTACFLARVTDGQIKVIGVGHQASRGLKAGGVTDIGAVEGSIRAAVDAAERMAGESAHAVLVGFSGGAPASHTVGVEIGIGGQAVQDFDLRKLLEHSAAAQEPGERQTIHTIPVGYTIDGTNGIHDPRGIFGDRLGVNMHIITAGGGPIRTLSVCVERCHLQLDRVVLSQYAAGLSCLVEDEMNLGVTLIDMGGGATKIAIFHDGTIIHSDTVPIGGSHVTTDIARGLSAPLAHAERLKTLYGSALPSPSDEREIIAVPQVGESEEESVNHLPRSILVSIIKPRLEETFEYVRDRLAISPLSRYAGRRVVLTGGAAQLHGARELAARVLDKQVRIGKPVGLEGLPEATSGPAFSACAGLMVYASRENREEIVSRSAPDSAWGGRLVRFRQWLQHNL